MSAQALTEEVSAFLKEYMEAFGSFSGARIAALYYTPCVTLRADGSIHCLQSRLDIERFFQGVADAYYRDGYRSSRFTNLDVVPIGGRSTLATVTWELLREDGSVLRQWRQSYNLVRVEKGWQILASTFHVN
ncbi:MAG: DUF4440 domain-containing protein [Candidatus Rokubacteria bacterium]|nr:DUF4440 domain-containing protein [Candidatus Rokubacteria bacterium]